MQSETSTTIIFWDHENPHANVWAGIIDDLVMGSHFLPQRFNGVMYGQFLEETFLGLLENVP